MPPHVGHDHSVPTAPTAPTGTAATFSTDSSFSLVITETNAAQTVTGKINVIDPDAGQACLDLARTLGYSTASSYYKTGEATQTGSYYGSKTIFTLLDNNTQLAVISDGDPYPAKAGYTILTNDLSVEREWPLVPNPLTEQDFEYKFTYRGGNLNSDASYSNFFSGTSSMGVQGIFLNGVALYNPSSGSGTVPGTTISGDNTYNLNAVFFEQQYGIDESAGHPSPEGNDVNGSKGQMHYHDPMFLTSDIWNNETFAYSNTYFSSDYYTPASGNIDYIRHANGHSKIVGFCFDGYPIYGPYGYDGSYNSTSPSVLMTTSYQTKTTPFYGRPYTYTDVVSGYTLSAGAFLDDYEYVPGIGSLDDCNGRFCVTPEYPNGTYAYFCLINEADEPVFPYILGKYSRQQRKVINAGYPADTHNTDGSVIPTTGTEGEFNVSTLGVSKYVSAPINETIVDVSYGSFTIDSSGNWSYTMDGPHDEFVTDVSYNDSIRVYSYDGSANRLVTVTMMGTAEAPLGPTPTILHENNSDNQGVMYSLNSPAAGEATVSGYSGPDAAAIVIPAQVVSSDGTTTYNVVKIGDYAFQFKNISSVTFNGNNLTSIGTEGFRASSLNSVTLPDSLQTISGYAFYDCPYMTTMHIGPNVTSIGSNLCTAQNMESFNVDAANTSFITDDHGILYHINSSANHNVSLVAVPAKFSGDANGEFSLGTFTKAGVTYTVTDCNYNSDDQIFRYSNITHLIIGHSVTAVVQSMFYAASPGIVNVTIGNGITNLNSQFNQYGNNLTVLSIGASVTSIDGNAFNNLTSLTIDPANTSFKVQDAILYQKVDAANATVFKVFGTVTNVTIPDTIVIGGGAGIPVTYIANNSFYGQKSLTAVTIGSNVKTIGYSAFGDDTSLNNVMFDANSLIEIIHAGAFSYTSMVSFIVPDSVTLFEGCFDGVVSLVELTINNSITTTDSFRGITSLVTLNYPVNHPNFVSDTNGFLYSKIDNDTHLSLVWIPNLIIIRSVTIPAAYDDISVTSIGDCVFQNQTITSVTNNAPLVTIGDRIFENNMNVETFLIPNTVTSIASMAFYSSGLKSIIIPDSVTVMPTCQGCSKLTSCTIGSGITELNLYSFAGVSTLNELVIGPNVTLINGACSGMTALKDVYFLGNNATSTYDGQNHDFFGYGQFVQDRTTDTLVSSIASNAVAYYVATKTGWSAYTSSNPPAGFSDIQTFDPEGSDSAPDHSSGPLTVADGDEIGNVSGGNVTVSSGTAAILSTGGTFAMDLTNGNANVRTLNGSVSASVSIGSGKSLSTSTGIFAGLLSGAGTLEKTGSADTLTLSGTNSGFLGIVAINAGIVETTTTDSLGRATVELGLQTSYINSVLKLNIPGYSINVIGNSIRALSSGSNILQNAGVAPVSLAGGVTKDGTIVRLLGSFVVNSDITGSSANSDVILGDGSTSTADVTLVSGNTYDYNGPTTVNTGSTLTLQDGVALPDSDVTINAGATLVLEYTTSTITANSVNSLTLSGATNAQWDAGIKNGATMIVNISINLTAGDYTVLAVNTNGYAVLYPYHSLLQVNYTGSNGSSASITKDSNGNFVVTITAPPTPTSNVCFPAKTPVMTNLGPVNIEDINPAVHTIRNKKIVAITKTVAHDKNLVRIAKHALGHLYPEKTTLISQNHKVFCQGQMIKAKHLVDDCNVTLVPYNGQVLYNVLLEEHEKMQVNNLIVETLHPEHKVAKLYRFLKNVDAAHHGKFIAAFNKKDIEQRLHR